MSTKLQSIIDRLKYSHETRIESLFLVDHEDGKTPRLFEIKVDKVGRFTETRRKKSKVYIWNSNQESPEIKAEMIAHKKELGIESMHTKRGEHPAMDKLWNKLNRDIVKRKKLIVCAALEHVGISAKPSYDNNCGCSCGCSGGFNLDGFRMPYSDNQHHGAGMRFDIYITELGEVVDNR